MMDPAQPFESVLRSFTWKQLREVCAALCLQRSGTREEMVERVVQRLRSGGSGGDKAPPNRKRKRPEDDTVRNLLDAFDALGAAASTSAGQQQQEMVGESATPAPAAVLPHRMPPPPRPLFCSPLYGAPLTVMGYPRVETGSPAMISFSGR